jgi:tetratricopeptide (TPR) repeat protein
MLYRALGQWINRKKIHRIIKLNNWQLRRRRKGNRPRARGWAARPDHPNELWEIDATHIMTEHGWCHLVAIIDIPGMSPQLPAPRPKLEELISMCVAKFVTKVAPHRVGFKITLERGKSGLVRTGNKFAAAHEWADAETYYRQAVAAKPDDHGAYFNLGVALEAQGRFQDAEAAYGRAIGLSPEQKYISRRRDMRRVAGLSG